MTGEVYTLSFTNISGGAARHESVAKKMADFGFC